MEELYSCRQAIENCTQTQTFAIAHLYKEENAMDMHIHDCYEIYYSISGGSPGFPGYFLRESLNL